MRINGREIDLYSFFKRKLLSSVVIWTFISQISVSLSAYNTMTMLRRVPLLFALLGVVSHAMGQLPGYQIFFGILNGSPKQIVLRQWKKQGQLTYLTVNPQTLETAVATLPNTSVQERTWSAIQQQFAQTPYGRALRTEQNRDHNIQDAGLERADTTEQGFSLTIDLCPSTKPLTRSVFNALIGAFEPEEKPVPVTISVTGLWMMNHASDLKFLKELVQRGDLSITWVNHSYHHRYDARLPLSVNFLLEHNTNMADEVLLNEQAMLQNGLLPSIFFRFPGLVSNKAIFDQVLSYGLLPIGSDAWLAKGQTPKEGSFVLIHANGNEPLGISDFIRLIRQKATSIQHKTWLLYELPASVAKADR